MIFKKLIFFPLLFLILCCSLSASAQTGKNLEANKTMDNVEFTIEDIEKIKTLIEQQLKTRISNSEFEQFGKATKENLALYRAIDETKKEDPFFSQAHISFIIYSMEERMGLKKPKSKNAFKANVQQKRQSKLQKLPKHKSDLQ